MVQNNDKEQNDILFYIYASVYTGYKANFKIFYKLTSRSIFFKLNKWELHSVTNFGKPMIQKKKTQKILKFIKIVFLI